MDYDEKKPEYKEDAGGEKKYYTVEQKQEEVKQNASIFDEIFYKIPKGGSIAAMPEYNEGMIYFPSCDTHVYALDAETGCMIWKFKTGEPTISTPLVHNGRLYFGSNDKYFYCLGLDGKLIWKKYLGDIIITYTTAIGDKIFTAAGRTFFCFSESGKELWRFVTGDGVFTSPTAVNGTIFFSSYDKHIYALDAETGRLKWRFAAGGPVGTPVIISDGNPLFTLSERSRDKIPEAQNPALYFASSDNNVYALNQHGELLWRFNCGSSFSTIVTCSKDMLYVGTVSGYLYAIDTGGTEKWKFRTGGMITSGAAIGEGTVYIGSWDGKIYCLSDKGEKLWDFLTGGPIAAESILVDNKIYFGSADTFFYCLNAERRAVEWTFQCGFGLPEALQSKITQVANTFTEYDKKIFRVWKPETKTAKSFGNALMQDYSAPAGFRSGGEMTYLSSSAGYKSDTSYLSKRKPYDKV